MIKTNSNKEYSEDGPRLGIATLLSWLPFLGLGGADKFYVNSILEKNKAGRKKAEKDKSVGKWAKIQLISLCLFFLIIPFIFDVFYTFMSMILLLFAVIFGSSIVNWFYPNKTGWKWRAPDKKDRTIIAVIIMLAIVSSITFALI